MAAVRNAFHYPLHPESDLTSRCYAVPLVDVPQIPEEVARKINRGSEELSAAEQQACDAAIAAAKKEINRRELSHRHGLPYVGRGFEEGRRS